ncbi:helix-turn-helix domain-containing protein [Nocardia sp. CA-145437]|uniref:helix-turn-helix domain-containing protein n=1 Tax=Nocardia sp. CA-145437 TaxID=3239980 RepID=UPI003D963934
MVDVEQANVIIGANLRALRAKKGLSREKLTELSGVPLRTLRRIESGERAASIPNLMELCKALGTNIGVFLDAAEKELDELARDEAGESRGDE